MGREQDVFVNGLTNGVAVVLCIHVVAQGDAETSSFSFIRRLIVSRETEQTVRTIPRRDIMAKRTRKSYNVETGVLTIDFVNGAREYDIDSLPEAMKRQLMLHGASQLLGDTYASETDEERYYVHADARFTKLQNGDWTARDGSGLEDKLAEAEDRLQAYIAMSDAEKLAVARFVNRSMIEKEIAQIKKAIARRDAKK